MNKLIKHLLLFAAFLSFCNSIFAQKDKGGGKKIGKGFTVEWGPDIKMKGLFPTEMLLYDKGSFYVSIVVPKAFSAAEYNLVKINDKLDIVLQNRIKTEEEDKKASYNHERGVMEVGDDMYVFEEEKVHHDKKINYYLEKVDKNTCAPAGNKKLIYSVDYSVDKDRQDDDVSIYADNESKFLAIYDQHKVDRKENAECTIRVLNSGFEKMWEKNITLPLIATRGGTGDFRRYIDPSSNYYLVSKVYKDDKRNSKEVKEGELNYDYHIYMMGENIKTYIDYPFHLKDKAVSQVRLDVKKKGDLVATGIYADVISEKNKVSIPKGIFFTTIDMEHATIKSQSYKEFGTEVFTAGLKDKQAEKEEKRIEKGKDVGFDFIIHDLINRKDGGSTMIAEEFRLEIVTYSNGRTTYTRYFYKFRNIIIAKISATGEIGWVSVIAKNQVMEGSDAACSYLLFDHDNDTYHVFFNEHRDNLSAAGPKGGGLKVMDNLKKAILVSVEVGADGSIGKKNEVVKLPPDDEKTHFYPKLSFIPENENDIILFGTEKSHEKFAKIHFDK